MRPQLANNPITRETDRQQIAQHVKAYLEKGGQIDRIQPPTTTNKPIGQTWSQLTYDIDL